MEIGATKRTAFAVSNFHNRPPNRLKNYFILRTKTTILTPKVGQLSVIASHTLGDKVG